MPVSYNSWMMVERFSFWTCLSTLNNRNDGPLFLKTKVASSVESAVTINFGSVFTILME